MNKKGSAFFVYMMMGVLFFVLGMALAPALTDTSNEARTELNCSITNDSNYKAVCYQIDSMSPFYVGILFSLGGLILARIVT